MSYRFDDKELRIVVFGMNNQLLEIPKSILIFLMCFYIDVRNKFDKDNELLF